MKASFKALLRRPLVWRVTRALRRARCVVLTYHRIGGPDEPFTHIPIHVFREQIAWLREHCDVLHPDQLRERATTPNRRSRPEVLITFDDGYRDYHDHASPVLERAGLYAINFLPTWFHDHQAPFWWDLLDAAIRSTPRAEASVPGAGAPAIVLDGRGRQEFGRACKAALKQSAAPGRSAYLDECLAALGFDRASVPMARQVMTWDEVRATRRATVFGGHSHTHPIMSRLDDGELDREVGTCARRIEEETGARPRYFAYPSGAFSERAKASVARHGYEVAFTTLPGEVDPATDWMSVNRTHAPATLASLAWMLSGWS